MVHKLKDIHNIRYLLQVDPRYLQLIVWQYYGKDEIKSLVRDNCIVRASAEEVKKYNNKTINIIEGRRIVRGTK